MKRIIFLVATCALWSIASLAQPATLTGAQILQKSAATYAQLKSYSGMTAVVSETNTPAVPTLIAYSTQTASAQIFFKRPGKLRISGHDSSGKPFTIISNDDSTWLSWPLNNDGKFGIVKDAQAAISSMAGVALRTPTYVPFALLGASGGLLFVRIEPAQLVGRETIGGVDCYRVLVDNSDGKRTFWVNTKTFLLRQFRQEKTAAQRQKGFQRIVADLKVRAPDSPALESLSKAASSPDEAGTSMDLYLFSNNQPNGEIPDGMFQSPQPNQ